VKNNPQMHSRLYSSQSIVMTRQQGKHFAVIVLFS